MLNCCYSPTERRRRQRRAARRRRAGCWGRQWAQDHHHQGHHQNSRLNLGPMENDAAAVACSGAASRQACTDCPHPWWAFGGDGDDDGGGDRGGTARLTRTHCAEAWPSPVRILGGGGDLVMTTKISSE